MSTFKPLKRSALEELAGKLAKGVMVSAIAARRVRKFEDPVNEQPAIVALLDLPFFKEREVPCQACNQTGIWTSEDKLHTGACSVCWLGRVAGRPGMMTILDVKGQAQFEAWKKKQEERKNRFSNQAPQRSEVDQTIDQLF